MSKLKAFFFCTGIGRFLPPPKGACILGTHMVKSGTQFCTDPCTCCTCTNSTLSCVRDTCPVLECPSELQTTLPNRCCPQCPAIQESRASCSYGGRTYQASITLLFIATNDIILRTRRKRTEGLSRINGLKWCRILINKWFTINKKSRIFFKYDFHISYKKISAYF